MARWVLQSVKSSVSRAARSRTNYLAPLQALVDDTIQQYFGGRPSGEDVTLAVLESVGRDRLEVVDASKPIDRKKQDLGLLVAQRLVALFGASNVLTFREDDGKAVSTRAARRPDLAWVTRYTPHRVTSPTASMRIVLDTVTVRKFVHADADALDVQQLLRIRGEHPISIADPAWAELVDALLRPNGGMKVEDWAMKVGDLTRLLDPDMPIVPSGREAGVMAGVIEMRGFNLGESQAFYKAVWRIIAEAKSISDFSRTLTFENPDGAQFAIGPLEHSVVSAALAERKAKWIAFIERLKTTVNPESLGPTLDQISALIRSTLRLDMPEVALDKIGLLIGVVSRYIVRALDEEQPPYSPDPNDAIDLDVLYAAVLPAIVCTFDRKMRRAAKESGSSDSWRVMDLAELVAYLENEAATAGVSAERAAVEAPE
jgi:hypothetical protein